MINTKKFKLSGTQYYGTVYNTIGKKTSKATYSILSEISSRVQPFIELFATATVVSCAFKRRNCSKNVVTMKRVDKCKNFSTFNKKHHHLHIQI